MFVIGERINGMFKDVRKAIEEKNPEPIKDLAIRQEKAGANALDINVGPAKTDPIKAMLWLIDCVQSVSKLPLAIDNPRLEIIREALPHCCGKAIINSSKADPEALAEYVPLAAKHNAGLIGLTIDAKGIPSDVDNRVLLGANILTACIEGGISPRDVYIDPIILPVNCDQKQPEFVMETIKQLRQVNDPPPHLVVGLSNISQSTRERPLINRTFAVMAVAAGLDAAILDPLDTELMRAIITAELLCNKHIYCDSYISAYFER